MARYFSKPGLLLLLTLVSPCSSAQDDTAVVSTHLQELRDSAKGAELAPRYEAIVELLTAKKLGEADTQAKALRADFEALFDPKQPHYCFQTQQEYDEYVRDRQERFEWIDWSYCLTLKAQAYVAVERGMFTDGLIQLRALEAVAPLSASTLTETAFTLGRLKRMDEALDTYGAALALARKFKSQQMYRAVALRGIGFAQIELGKLDEAEQAYKESLQFDPNNKLTANELEYIRRARASKS